jgi:hypothetical protein
MRTSFDPTRPSGTSLGGADENNTTGLPPELSERALRKESEWRLSHYILEGGVKEFGPCDALPNPVLFRTEPGDASPVDLSDVRQNLNEDCFLLAPLGALTRTEAGRALIQNMVTENRNERGEVVSYTVKLHEPTSNWMRGEGFKEVNVTVEPQFECGHAKARRDGNSSEIWPVVIEAAYAKLVGGYDQIQRGNAAKAMLILTGNVPDTFGLGWLSRGYDAERLKSDLAAGHVVVFDTRDNVTALSSQFPEEVQDLLYLPGAYNLYAAHSYVAIGTEEHDGKEYVLLHNPWNHDEPQAVPFDDLRAYFKAIHVGRVQ